MYAQSLRVGHAADRKRLSIAGRLFAVALVLLGRAPAVGHGSPGEIADIVGGRRSSRSRTAGQPGVAPVGAIEPDTVPAIRDDQGQLAFTGYADIDRDG